MKRISEIFELPIKSPTWSVTNVIDVNNKSVTEFKNREQAEVAVRAINHVDALADALDECLEEMEMQGMHGNRVYLLAREALNAYRGV